MTKLEKKSLLEYISQLESQKIFLESELFDLGFNNYLSHDFSDSELSSEDRALFLLGKISSYRACLSVIKSYFCYHGTDNM